MDVSTTVVAVVGDIDLGDTPQLHRHLLVLPDWDTVLDMRGVSLLAARTVINGTDRALRAPPCRAPARGWPWQNGLDKLFRRERGTEDRRSIEAETTEIIPVLRERLTGAGSPAESLPELSCSAGGGLADVGDDDAGDLAQLDIAVL